MFTLKRTMLYCVTAVLLFQATGQIIIELPAREVNIVTQNQPNNSASPKMLQLTSNQEKQHSYQNHLNAEDVFMAPCKCSDDDLLNIFDPYTGPGPQFLPSVVDGKAQTITLPTKIEAIEACRLAEGVSMCGRPLFEVTDGETFQEISKWRHKGVTWDEVTSEIILDPQGSDPTGLHKILITARLPGLEDVSKTIEIAYIVNSTPARRKLQGLVVVDQPEQKTIKSRQLVITGSIPQPAAPTTAISGSDPNNVEITWVKPVVQGQGAPLQITGFTILILQSDGTTFTAAACTGGVDINCTPICKCTIPIATLKAAPYNLPGAASVQATVFATNSQGDSVTSLSGNGAVLPQTEPSIPAAPTTAISGTNVVTNWVAPSNGGSAITGFTVAVRQSDGTTFTVTACTGAVISCTTACSCNIPIATLKAAPYNLVAPASVFATVLATSSLGSSAASVAGNGAVIPPTNPDPPTSLTNSAAVTSSSVIGFTWTAPANNGGSPVLDYKIQWDQGSSSWDNLDSSISLTSYTTTASLVANKVYKFKVQSRNSVGFSVWSSEVAITTLAAAVAAVPATPTAPTTAISGTNVVTNWVAPADGGSVITGYTVVIRQSDGVTYTTFPGCSGTTLICTIPISALQTAPYSLADGAGVFAKVLATNNIGSSAYSSAGNGAAINLITIPSVPAAPTSKMNSNTSVTITWVAPSDGGSAVTAYTVAIRQSDGTTFTTESTKCNVSTTTCTVPISILQASPYNLPWGTSVYSTVIATNLIGSSAASVPGNGAVMATYPDPPRSLANSSLTATDITLAWSTGFSNGGLAVLDYQVFWDQGTGNYVQLESGVEKTTYTTTVSLLPNKAYKFKVKARNAFGTSEYSNEVSIKLTEGKLKPLPLIALNAVVNKEATLILSDVGAQYVLQGTQTFKASVAGNVLTVLSTDPQDSGKRSNLLLSAMTTLGVSNVTVEVTFSAATSATSNFAVTATQPSTVSNGTVTDQSALTLDEQESLLKVIVCDVDENGSISCVNPNTGLNYYFNYFGQLVKGTAPPKSSEVRKYPTLTISKVNSKGSLTLKFSEAMNLDTLVNTTWEGRNLQNASLEHKNLLSHDHLKLRISSVNEIIPKFEWYAKNITNKTIAIQLVFEKPLEISKENGHPDRLIVTILPPALKYFKTLKDGSLTQNPLQTQSKILPPQVVPGSAIENLESAAETLEVGGKAAMASNIALQVALAGSMAQMWSLQNSLLTIISFQQVNLAMPGNVNMVIVSLSDLSSFNVFETDQILEYCFTFTQTELPGVGFQSLGIENKRIIIYLGPTCIIFCISVTLYLLFGLILPLKNRFAAFTWLEEKMRVFLSLKYGHILTLVIQSYLDISVGSNLSFEQVEFKTASDIFDFTLSLVCLLGIFVIPTLNYIFLKRNIKELDKNEFKDKFGSLYNGYLTGTAEQRQAVIYMSNWFLIRRALTAVNLVYVRHLPIWFQLTFNMLLCFGDMVIKLYLRPYAPTLAGWINVINDSIVLVLSYFLYVFTDLTPSQEDKYQIGWIYNGLLGVLVLGNLYLILSCGLLDLVRKCKQNQAQKLAKKKRLATLMLMKQLISVKTRPLGNQMDTKIGSNREEFNGSGELAKKVAREFDQLSEIEEESLFKEESKFNSSSRLKESESSLQQSLSVSQISHESFAPKLADQGTDQILLPSSILKLGSSITSSVSKQPQTDMIIPRTPAPMAKSKTMVGPKKSIIKTLKPVQNFILAKLVPSKTIGAINSIKNSLKAATKHELSDIGAVKRAQSVESQKLQSSNSNNSKDTTDLELQTFDRKKQIKNSNWPFLNVTQPRVSELAVVALNSKRDRSKGSVKTVLKKGEVDFLEQNAVMAQEKKRYDSSYVRKLLQS